MRIKCEGRYLRDFGSGVSDDIEKAHDFTSDEAMVLCVLYGYVPDGPNYGDGITIDASRPPDVNPGEDMVWVSYKGCWLAASRQALFMGTRKAVKAPDDFVTIEDFDEGGDYA